MSAAPQSFMALDDRQLRAEEETARDELDAARQRAREVCQALDDGKRTSEMIAAHPKYVAADTAVVAALVRYAGVRTEIGARHHRAEFNGQSEIQTFIAKRTREREIEQARRKPALPFLK